MDPAVWVPIAGGLLSALIVSGVALLIWGIHTLIRMTERLSRLEAGQAKVEASLDEIRRLLSQSQVPTAENP